MTLMLALLVRSSFQFMPFLYVHAFCLYSCLCAKLMLSLSGAPGCPGALLLQRFGFTFPLTLTTIHFVISFLGALIAIEVSGGMRAAQTLLRRVTHLPNSTDTFPIARSARHLDAKWLCMPSLLSWCNFFPLRASFPLYFSLPVQMLRVRPKAAIDSGALTRWILPMAAVTCFNVVLAQLSVRYIPLHTLLLTKALSPGLTGTALDHSAAAVVNMFVRNRGSAFPCTHSC